VSPPPCFDDDLEQPVSLVSGESLRRISVLGAGGFLGSHLVQALLARTSAELIAVDTNLSKLDLGAEQRHRVRCIEASIRDPALVDRVVTESNAVVSMTALCNPSLYNTRPREVIDANYSDLEPLVERCAEQRRWLIHFSTCEVYGRGVSAGGEPELMSEDETPLTLGPVHLERWSYACAKQLLERLIWAHGSHGELPFTIIRPFNVVGPRMDYLPGVDGEGIPRVLACFMNALLRQQPLDLVDGGHQRRAFIYVDDMTDATIKIIEARDRCLGEVINIGHPENDISIAELARALIEIYSERYGGDRALPTRNVSAQTYYGPGYDDVVRRRPDIAKIERLVGWRPTTSLAQMLPLIIDDYVERYGDVRSARGPAYVRSAG
jgi:UDP-apiose/xylose synthase